MPKRNIIKIYGADEYYHVYNRGANRQDIFFEDNDYWYFIDLIKKRLSCECFFDKNGRELPRYGDEVQLVAYCLMPNHFHLLCYLIEPDGLMHLMRSAMTAYTLYFNKKYHRSGKLYESNFLAARVNSDQYLWQVSRYIHLNPVDIGYDYLGYKHSSLPYFLGENHPSWIHTEKLVETNKEVDNYHQFVSDFENAQNDIKSIGKILGE